MPTDFGFCFSIRFIIISELENDIWTNLSLLLKTKSRFIIIRYCFPPTSRFLSVSSLDILMSIFTLEHNTTWQKTGLYLIPAHLHCGQPGQARKFSLGLIWAILYPPPIRFILNLRSIGIPKVVLYNLLTCDSPCDLPAEYVGISKGPCLYCVGCGGGGGDGEVEQVIRVARQRSINK